jgi:hypothetical protein
VAWHEPRDGTEQRSDALWPALLAPRCPASDSHRRDGVNGRDEEAAQGRPQQDHRREGAPVRRAEQVALGIRRPVHKRQREEDRQGDVDGREDGRADEVAVVGSLRKRGRL